MKHVLVVDDEPSITILLKYNLEKEGLTVTVAHDGEEAVSQASQTNFDFIVLDLMLPKLDGFEVTKKLRQMQIDTPILMLTAKDEVIDKIIGLEIGADDYLTKPFSPRELLARMRAVHRRMTTTAGASPQGPVEPVAKIEVGLLAAYPNDYQVNKDGQEITLTKKEFELLVYFMERKNRVIDRDTLIQGVWQEELYNNSRTVDIHVSHLRDKIEDDPKNPNYLITIRGFGYKFQEPK